MKDDFSHPFLENRKTILIYVVTCLLLAGGYVLLLNWQTSFPLRVSITEAVLSLSVLGILGLALWYPVRYIEAVSYSGFFVFTGYLFAGALLVFVWLSSTGMILRNIWPDQADYQAYLADSRGYKALAGIFVYLIVILVYYLMVSMVRLGEKEREEARLESLVKESELKMLRSQINPHFLFNSLNSISSLTVSDPEKARDMVIRLSDFFRYSIDHKLEEEAELEKELQNIENYLAIEQVRFGDRFVFSAEVSPGCLKRKLPNLLLQPLIENAIKHGVYESTRQVAIRLSAREEEDRLIVLISNEYDPDSPSGNRQGIGLQNIARRLKLIYGKEGLLRIEKPEQRFEVHLIIPQSHEE